MNAHANVLHRSGRLTYLEREEVASRTGFIPKENGWNPEEFARQQIRGLVRQVFFGNDSAGMKQVVFTAVEANTDVAGICERVGKALALETRAHVAIVRREHQSAGRKNVRFSLDPRIKSRSKQLSGNVWRVPGFGLCEGTEGVGTAHYWLSCLADLRNEFEYAVIQAPAAGVSSEAAMLGQLADGVILVLEAHTTRKAAARKIKESLGAQSRILGIVLTERRFPVPERIYRRL